tara:strand:- start:2936 stop:4669 length:1734 start_codon:yes stop_codon:yes gene_type:complete
MKKIIFDYLLDNNKFYLFLIIILTFLNIFLEVIGLTLFIPLLKILLVKDSYVYYLENYLNYQYFLDLNYSDFLLFLLISIFLIIVIKNLLIVLSTYVQHVFFNKFEINITTKLFKNYLNKEFIFFSNANSSIILRNLRNETASTLIYFQSLISIITEFLILIGIIVFLFSTNFLSTLIVISITAPAILVYNMTTKKFLLELGKKRILLDGVINRNFTESIGAIKELKLYGKESVFVELARSNLKKFFRIHIIFAILNFFPRHMLEILIVSSLLVIIFLIENNLILTNSGGTFVVLGLFAVASARILPSVSKLLTNYQSLRFRISSVYLISSEIEKSNELQASKDLDFEDNDNLFITNKKFAINLRNVSFKYPESLKNILKNINLDLVTNKIYGIVGKTGSGKTTLIDLISGFHKPSDGKILANDIDISNNLSKWRKNFAYVSQNIFLFDSSIEKNISLETDEKLIDKKILDQALKDSQLSEFVNNLPNNSKTFVGQNGARLSGGQIQRIGIARAIYQKSKCVIFDESTNALDEITEVEILKMIQKIKKDKLIIIISHNKSSLKICDEIITVKDGSLI